MIPWTLWRKKAIEMQSEFLEQVLEKYKGYRSVYYRDTILNVPTHTLICLFCTAPLYIIMHGLCHSRGGHSCSLAKKYFERLLISLKLGLLYIFWYLVL